MKKLLLKVLGVILLVLCGGANAVAQQWPDPQSRSARSWLSDLEDENEGVRIAAAHALWRIGHPDSTVDVQALIDALEDESHSVRLYAAMALIADNDTAGQQAAVMVLGLTAMDVETAPEPFSACEASAQSPLRPFRHSLTPSRMKGPKSAWWL